MISPYIRPDALNDLNRLIAEFKTDDAAWRSNRQGYLYVRRCASFHSAMATLTAYTRVGLISYEEYKPRWQELYDLYFTDENCKTVAKIVVDDIIKVA
jgi:hypothetical protein